MIQAKSKYFRADKVKYKDGVGCCIWQPFPEDEEIGICMDISADQIDDLIELLIQLKEIPAIDFEEEI